MAVRRIAHIYRSCLFQIIVVGLVALCEPGIWTALNNLGAGGQASVSPDRCHSQSLRQLLVLFIFCLILGAKGFFAYTTLLWLAYTK